jgi:asparagine synthase (glutamine-hydrolysing)
VSGIVAMAHRGAEPVAPALLERMTTAMGADGPRGHKCWSDAEIGLGYANLGMGDAGFDSQPFSIDGRAWITADARIDGRSRLIDELRAGGRNLEADETDERLILHGYLTWGEACVERLLGDFAFAIWDVDNRALFCARDHFGLTPLYYATPGDVLLISTALQSVTTHPDVSDALDERTIGDFLLCGSNLDTARTIFAQVRAVPPAHTLTWSSDGIRLRRYWQLRDGADYVRLTRPRDYVERFAAVFDEAVSDRIRGDAVGAQLSGGMDSSSLAVTAHRVLRSRGRPFDLRGYTIVYEWLAEEEEGRYAQEVAEMLDVPVERVVAEDYMARAPDAAPSWVLPAPWGIAELSPDYAAIRRMSTRAPVVLTGLGGDPLLATPETMLDWRGAPLAIAHSFLLGRRPRLGLRTALRRRRTQPSVAPMPVWVNPEFSRRVDLVTRQHEVTALAHVAGAREAMLSPFWVDTFQSAHAGIFGLPVKLAFPYFDLRLVRSVLETPPVPWRQEKQLLREAMRGRLPERVRLRPKTPLHHANPGRDDAHPWYRLSNHVETRSWRRHLIQTAPIGEFIDVTRALAAIENPPPDGRAVIALAHCLNLAHWLQHRSQPVPHRQGLV